MDKIERLLFDADEWEELAKAMKKHAWPLSPAVADESDGWTYSRVLHAFGVPPSLVVCGSRGWLVFATRMSLINFVRNSQLLLF